MREKKHPEEAAEIKRAQIDNEGFRGLQENMKRRDVYTVGIPE